MQVDPKKSREAHSQTGHLTQAAASSTSQHRDSPAHCDLRGPQPASCRGDGAGQWFRPWLDPAELTKVVDDRPDLYAQLHLSASAFQPASWREGAVPIGLGATAAIIVGAVIAYLQSKGILQ